MNPQQKPAQITVLEENVLDKIIEQQQQAKSRYMPVMSPAEFGERERAIQYLIDNLMVEGVDYGWVPGTKPSSPGAKDEYRAKPTLFKAGAEKACSFFGYAPRFLELTVIEEWNADKFGEPLFYYKFQCELSKDNALVGSGIGSATTWESKYRYRNAERTCPSCGKPNIRKSKPKPNQREDPGFYCWERTGGCGATFASNDESITGQVLGRTANPDIADVINTVQKMGQKRAYVAATLTATGLSSRFTQDLEDLPAPPQSQQSAPGPRVVELSFEEQFRQATTYQRLNVFGTLKTRFATLLNDKDKGDALYYDHLMASGVEHANQFKSVAQALQCANAMRSHLATLEAGTQAFGVDVPPPDEGPF